MSKLNINKEWKKLKYELFENKPKEFPFPQKIIKKRELLLLAQNLLADYGFSNSEVEKSLYRNLYQETMMEYFEPS